MIDLSALLVARQNEKNWQAIVATVCGLLFLAMISWYGVYRFCLYAGVIK